MLADLPVDPVGWPEKPTVFLSWWMLSPPKGMIALALDNTQANIFENGGRETHGDDLDEGDDE